MGQGAGRCWWKPRRHGHGDGRVGCTKEGLGSGAAGARTSGGLHLRRSWSGALVKCWPPSDVRLALFADADAGGQREAYRRYYSATVEPLAVMLERELSDKLEVDIGLSFSGRFSGDLAGRARAFQSMVGGRNGHQQSGRLGRADGGGGLTDGR